MNRDPEFTLEVGQGQIVQKQILPFLENDLGDEQCLTQRAAAQLLEDIAPGQQAGHCDPAAEPAVLHRIKQKLDPRALGKLVCEIGQFRIGRFSGDQRNAPAAERFCLIESFPRLIPEQWDQPYAIFDLRKLLVVLKGREIFFGFEVELIGGKDETAAAG